MGLLQMSFCFNSKMHGKVRKPLKSNTRSYIDLLRAALSSVQNKILRLKSMKLRFLSVLKFRFFFLVRELGLMKMP